MSSISRIRGPNLQIKLFIDCNTLYCRIYILNNAPGFYICVCIIIFYCFDAQAFATLSLNDHEKEKIAPLRPGPTEHNVKSNDQMVIIMWI